MVPETERILNLPEHDLQPQDVDDKKIQEVTERYAKDGGDYTLNEVQTVALEVIENAGGMVGGIGVGAGKTLIGLLASRAINRSERFSTEIRPYDTLYLTPASLQETVEAELDKWKPHFDVDEHVRICSYGKLSHPTSGRELIESYQPRLMILDEAHKVSKAGAARTKRLLEYLHDNPGTHLIAMSGTLTNRSIEDYQHFLQYALGPQNSPLPNDYMDFEGWKRVLDPESSRQSYPTEADWRRVSPLVEVYGCGRKALSIDDYQTRVDEARDAYLERFKSAPGVVKTSKSAAQSSLQIRVEDDIEVPEGIGAAIEEIEDLWILPGGEEIDDQLSFYRAKRQASTGYYYHWNWNIEPYHGEKDREWLYARREWEQAQRTLVNDGPDEIDSPYFAREAVKNGEVQDPEILERWDEWCEHRHKPEPPTVSERLDDFIMQDAIEKAGSSGRASIIWYDFRETARWLEELGVDVYWPAGDRNPENASPGSSGTIACSISSHARGKNLQQFSHSIVVAPPSSGTRWEQLLGRTHRPGQDRDTVLVDTYAHTVVFEDALERAVENARFTRDTEGCKQKLLYADWIPPQYQISS